MSTLTTENMISEENLPYVISTQCPRCKKGYAVLKTAKSDGSRFWGCSEWSYENKESCGWTQDYVKSLEQICEAGAAWVRECHQLASLSLVQAEYAAAQVRADAESG